MKLVVTSDTHEQHTKLRVPDGDIFLFAGDFTMIGESKWVEHFNEWLGTLPHKYKVVIAGNHDRSLDLVDTEGRTLEEARSYGQNRLSNATHYLLDNGCEIEGLKFWGSPYTPFFSSDYWKFHYDRAAGEKQWAGIPEGLDVLLTHGPADRILDKTLEGDFTGCYELMRRIEVAKPRFHFFGHIHEDYGHRSWKGTEHYNVAAVDRLYRMRESPCVELEL